MSELSPELRKHYEIALSRQGGIGGLIGAIVGYFLICAGIEYFISDETYRGLAMMAAVFAIAWWYISSRREEVADQKKRAEAMPDDRLAAAFAEHEKSANRSVWLWAIAGIAILFGLLFTPQGNDLLGVIHYEWYHGAGKPQ